MGPNNDPKIIFFETCFLHHLKDKTKWSAMQALSIPLHQTRQLMWFRHLVTVEAFPTGKRPGGKSRTGWSDYFSQLAADLTCQSNSTMTDLSLSEI